MKKRINWDAVGMFLIVIGGAIAVFGDDIFKEKA